MFLDESFYIFCKNIIVVLWVMRRVAMISQVLSRSTIIVRRFEEYWVKSTIAKIGRLRLRASALEKDWVSNDH